MSKVRNCWGNSLNDFVSTAQKPYSGWLGTSDFRAVTVFRWWCPEIHRIRFGNSFSFWMIAVSSSLLYYIFRSIPTHFRIETFQFQTESWPFKNHVFMSVCPINRLQIGWKHKRLIQNNPNSGAYPVNGTFFRSIPVHPIFGGRKISLFRSMSVHFWMLVVLLLALSGAYPFTDWCFSFSGAYPFTRTFIRTFAV